jgi:hypothetical protein
VCHKRIIDENILRGKVTLFFKILLFTRQNPPNLVVQTPEASGAVKKSKSDAGMAVGLKTFL